MRYTSTINNLKCVEWGLTLSQAFLLDILIISDLWAKRETVNDVDYRWVSRNKVLDEIPHAYKTPDTVYRSLKDLAKKGIIDYKKMGKKDLVRLTEKGKEWVFCQSGFENKVGKKSELNSNSEINPSKFGNKSELNAKNAELNPTDNGTNFYKSTNDDGGSADLVEKIKNSNSEFVDKWQPPSKESMELILLKSGTPMQMTDGQYQVYIDEFKGHFKQRALDGYPLKNDSRCKAKLRDWLQRERKNHLAIQVDASSAVAKTHSNRSDAFSNNQPTLSREEQIKRNEEAMRLAGLAL